MTDTPENVKILNEKLGITSRDNLFNAYGVSSINELFESSKRDFELLCKDISDKKSEVEEAEEGAKDSFDSFKEISNADNPEYKIAAIENTSVALVNFGETIQSMKQLIDRGNDIVGKLYDAIVNTDIIDPDLLNAAAGIIHSVRESNDNLIQFSTQKMNLEHQYRLAMDTEKLKQKHKLELEYFKFKLRQQEIENKDRLKREAEASKTVDVTVKDNGSSKTWNQSEMAEFIRNSKDN